METISSHASGIDRLLPPGNRRAMTREVVGARATAAPFLHRVSPSVRRSHVRRGPRVGRDERATTAISVNRRASSRRCRPRSQPRPKRSLTAAPSTAVVSDHPAHRPAALPILYVGVRDLLVRRVFDNEGDQPGRHRGESGHEGAASNPAAMIGVKAAVTTLSIVAAGSHVEERQPGGRGCD